MKADGLGVEWGPVVVPRPSPGFEHQYGDAVWENDMKGDGDASLGVTPYPRALSRSEEGITSSRADSIWSTRAAQDCPDTNSARTVG